MIVPAGIGVAAPRTRVGAFVRPRGCSYSVRTLDPTGVVEVRRGARLTLGRLFAVWGQPLGLSGALGYRGPLAALVNGLPFAGDPQAVDLKNFENIVLELGRPPATPPPSSYDFGTMRR